MKKIKKILLIVISVLTVSNLTVFADSFEAIVNVPIGLSISIPTGSYRESFLDKNADRSGNIVADAGVSAQIGYLFDIDKYDDIGVSLLAEIGYQYNVYSYMSHLNKHYDNGFSIDDKLNYYLKAHNFQLGLLPKFVKGNFAFGVGFGVKFPLSLIISTENIIIETVATTKLGTAIPKVAATITALSTNLPCLNAATMPNKTPIVVEINMLNIPSLKDTGNALTIVPETDCPILVREVPKSPLIALFK